MPITTNQYNKMLARLTALEQHHNNVVVAMENFSTLEQLQELLVVIQGSIEALTVQVDSLYERVVAIEEEPL